MEHYLTNWITQCYLPPDTGERAPACRRVLNLLGLYLVPISALGIPNPAIFFGNPTGQISSRNWQMQTVTHPSSNRVWHRANTLITR